MEFSRALAMHRPRSFGRGPVRVIAEPVPMMPKITDDLKLFATTFIAGFLFVSILFG